MRHRNILLVNTLDEVFNQMELYGSMGIPGKWKLDGLSGFMVLVINNEILYFYNNIRYTCFNEFKEEISIKVRRRI